MSINWSELRGWIQLIFIILGGWIGLQNYLKQQRQQKYNNSYSIINNFQKALQENDLEIWKEIVRSSYEGVGVKDGYFRFYSKDYELSSLFLTEGQGLLVQGYDEESNLKEANYGGSIRRISEQLNFIGYQVLNGYLDLRIIYFELGQIMDSIYQWMTDEEGVSQFCTLAFLRGVETLGLSLCWLMFLQKRDAPDEEYQNYLYFYKMYSENIHKFNTWDKKIYVSMC